MVISLACLLTLPNVALADDSEILDGIQRGEYLTTILGCSGCHTEGALLGDATGPWLAGSKIGVAYAEDEHGLATAVVFPRNLTSDRQTGLGDWTKSQIVDVITTGIDHTGNMAVPVMPWPNYKLLKAGDVSDIADYLMSLPPVYHAIPNPIEPGEQIDEPYVRIGVYVFSPNHSELALPDYPQPDQTDSPNPECLKRNC